MQTLHDILKRNPEGERQPGQAVDLRGRYSKIGISAVAAATQFNHVEDASTAKAAGPRSAPRDTAHGDR